MFIGEIRRSIFVEDFIKWMYNKSLTKYLYQINVLFDRKNHCCYGGREKGRKKM